MLPHAHLNHSFLHKFCILFHEQSVSYFFISCIAAFLGAHVILTDLPERLKLLKKNVEANLCGNVRGSASVAELTWGTNLDPDFYDPFPDYGISLQDSPLLWITQLLLLTS